MANKVGKPPFFKTAKQFQKKVDEYFESLKGEVAIGKDGRPKFEKGKLVYMVSPKAPSMAGLAVFCGFKTKQGLFNQKDRGEDFESVYNGAKLRMEAFCYQKLFDKDTFQGAKFCLVYNHGVDEPEDDKDFNVTVEVVSNAPSNHT